MIHSGANQPTSAISASPGDDIIYLLPSSPQRLFVFYFFELTHRHDVKMMITNPKWFLIRKDE